MLVLSLEPAADPSPWLPQNNSSIGILSTPSKEKASPESKVKSSGIASKETATSEPLNLRNLLHHRFSDTTGGHLLRRVLVLTDNRLLPKANKDAIFLHFYISD
jgi:hypothetical protein